MHNRKSFSLVELMIVLGLVLFLAALTVPAIGPMLSNARLKMGASAVKSSLDMARSMAFSSGDVTRVVLGFDPRGGRLESDLALLTGMAGEAGAKAIDVNGDGVAHWYQSDNYKWFKFFLVKSDKQPENELDLATLDPAVGDYFGPFWMYRPIMHKSVDGIEGAQTYMAYKHSYFDTNGLYYYRPVINKSSFKELGEANLADIIAPMVKNSKNQYESLMLSGESQTFAFDVDMASVSGVGGWWTLFLNSARMYGARDNDRLMMQVGAEFTVIQDAYKLIYLNYNADVENSTAYISSIISSNQLLDDDDEDGFLDEGMSVYIQKYNSKGYNMHIVLPMDIGDPTKFNTYNYYFGAHENVNMNATKEYTISGPDYTEEMVRRIWVVPEGELNYVLAWKFDDNVDLSSNVLLSSLNKMLPYFFGVIFDPVNNSLSVQSSFGSANISRILCQLSDLSGEKSIYVLYRMGQSWSGDAEDLKIVESILPDVYKGEIKQ